MVDLSLLQDFIAETTEYLEEMEGCFLRLEADPGNRMILDDIFRSVHTIKGAAEYLGLEKIAELSRAIENLLYHQLHCSEPTCSREVLDLLAGGRERLGRLMRNLEKEEKETIPIDDLIESIRVVDTTSRISEEIRKVAADGEDSTLNDELLAERLSFSETEEDESDEELFAIFLEQLEEKLNQLSFQSEALFEADPRSQAEILGSCHALVDALRAAANYMGYEQLTSFYEMWQTNIEDGRLNLLEEGEKLPPDFISGCMKNNIQALAKRFPRLNLTPPEQETGKASNPPASEPAAVKPGGEEKTEIPVFRNGDGDDDGTVAAAGDILDEYAGKASPGSPPKEEGKDQQDDNLFERLSWSFDNRIKQNPTPQDEDDLIEIETELFSAPAEPSDAPPTAPAATGASEPPGRAEKPAEKPEKEAGEKKTDTAAGIMSIFDDYREENDTELFVIFQELIEEVLGSLQLQVDILRENDDCNRTAVLEFCLEQLGRLNSAANYMGYEQLLNFYGSWRAEITAAIDRLAKGETGDFDRFIAETLESRIHALIEMFPDVTPAKPAPAPGTAGETPAAATGDRPPTAESERIATPETAAGQASPAGVSAESAPAAPADTSMLADFIAETQEHLEEMEENLLLLDSDSLRRETLDDIFRSVHTIKGAAEYLGIERISSLTHNLENLLYQLRQDKIKVSREIIDLLMAGWDRVSLLVKNLEEKQVEEAEIDDLLERIRTLGKGDRKRPEATTAEPEETISAARPATATADSPHPKPTADRAGRPDTAAAAPEKSAENVPEKSVKRSIRVEAGKIDALMNQVGELVVSRAGFTQILGEMQNLQHELKQNLKLDTREMRQFTGMTTRLGETTTLFEKVINELQGEVMKVRMLPISQLFNRYPRLVYDLVRNTGKQVKLDIEGAETELDKMVIEEISDPLIHIIRNAVDHGIETTEERRRKGKPETGTIKLKAYHEGNHVIIEIIDDGRGLDLELIKRKALDGNFVKPADLEQMSTQEITGLIMKPGFSTAAKVTHISGRGVGMDVVRKNIEKLNGTIEIDTTPGVEMHFRIKIPLTLAIIPALRVRVSDELFTIPLSTVEETLKTSWDKVFTIEGIEVLSFRESTLPLLRMANLFNLEKTASTEEQPDQAYIVVVSTGMKRMGLVVNELMGQENVVIKPLEDYIQEKSGFSGATILGDGRISLILDVYELINLAVSQRGKGRSRGSAGNWGPGILSP